MTRRATHLPQVSKPSPAECLIVLCHGVRADGSQLAGLEAALHAAIPGAAFLRPDAPEPGGASLGARLLGRRSQGRQWFSLGLPKQGHIGACQEAAGALNARVDRELARLGLLAGAVWFCGFSQGAMVCLLAGLGRPVAPLGIVGIAGALLADERFQPAAQPPVLLIHGGADPVVPALRAEIAARRLRNAGLRVTLDLLPGQDHLIVGQAAPIAAAFIAGGGI